MRKTLAILIVLFLAANCFGLELERQKNVATVINFPLIDSTTTTALQSGATGLDSEIDQYSDSGDNPDGFADCTNEATEIGSTGQYYLILTQSEMNENYIIIQIKASDALTQTMIIRTTIGDPLNYATTDDGSTINVTGGAIDTVTTTTTATATTTVNGLAANIITTASINDGAITDAKIVTIGVNLIQVNGNSTPINNWEATYDSTGYNDDVAPAQQQQLDNIANTGAAINTVAESATVTEGEETNTYTATQSLDSVYHEIEDDAINTGQIDLYYEFDIGTTGVPVSATFHGRLYDPPATGDVITIYANTWGSGWAQVGTLDGINNDTPAGDVTETVTLFTNHVGLGGDAGRVQLRFFDNGNVSNNTILKIDLIYCSYSVVVSPVGYANGQIWVDTVNGTAGTAEGINGVADNPVNSWVDALNLSTTTGLTSFNIGNGSTITLTDTVDNFTLEGKEWTLALAGKSCNEAVFIGALVSGTCTGSAVIFKDCGLALGGTLTVAGIKAHDCSLAGDIVLTAVNTYYFDQCYSGVAGTATPSIDFGSGVANQNINFRHYSGGIEIKNIGTNGTDNMSLEGWGQLILNNNADGGTIAIRGNFTIVDNAAGGYSGTLSDDARFASAEQATATVDEWESQSQSNPTGFHINLLEVEGTDATTYWESRSLAAAAYYIFSTDPVELLDSGGSAGTSADELVDDIWDEVLTAATHNVATSSGRRLREFASMVIISGTSPDSGGTANTLIRIELDGDASAVDGAYDPANVCITGGTGVGQSRQIWEYDGTNKYAYINRDWKVIPDNTSEYVVYGSTGNAHVNEGLARGGGASTITLNVLASDIPNAYRGQVVFIAAGVGQDQRGVIVSYDESTKIATMEQPWETQPTSGSVYMVWPGGIQLLADMVDEWETQSQSDPTGFHINLKELDGTAVKSTGGNIHALPGNI